VNKSFRSVVEPLLEKSAGEGINFITLDSIEKAVAFANPDRIYVIDREKDNFNPYGIASEIKMGKSIMFVLKAGPDELKTDRKTSVVGLGKSLSWDSIVSIMLYEVERIGLRGKLYER